MKRFLCVLCTLIMIFSCFAGLTVFAEENSEPVYGDVNGDGVLDVLDVVLLRGSIVGNVKLTVQEYARGEMNGDGQIDIIDVVMMRNAIITGEGVYDQSGLKIETTELYLHKGACALVYTETLNPKKLKFICSSDYIEAKMGMDVDSNTIAIAVFVNKTDKTDRIEKIKVFVEGNESNAKYINVTVRANDNLAEYYNHAGVPDFGTVCKVTPNEVAIDGTTYAYSANQIADIYGEEEMVAMYERYCDILEDYGYNFKISYNVNGGGEVLNYVSYDGKTVIEFGSMPNPDEEGEWRIVLGIMETK